jgi:hypothetical protein
VYHLDPLRDPRWTALAERHPRASIFHTSGWLEALRRTYGYDVMAFTSSAAGEPLRNGVVFCGIRSWLTGRRLVSLPFSDHCDPLVESEQDLAGLLAHVQREQARGGWGRVELRPRDEFSSVTAGSASAAFGTSTPAPYYLHTLDLAPPLDRLFGALHRDSIQRKIRRAEREGLTCEEGRGPDLLRAFYRLQVQTRLRHRVPPQPSRWFRNLADCLGNALTIRIARRNRDVVAGVVTLAHGTTVVYKYGASDAAFHPLGGMPFLLWHVIRDARAAGCRTLDLGRSSAAQQGLLTFKDRLGARRSPLGYWQLPAHEGADGPFRSTAGRVARQVVRHVPVRWQAATGRLLYRHVG